MKHYFITIAKLLHKTTITSQLISDMLGTLNVGSFNGTLTKKEDFVITIKGSLTEMQERLIRLYIRDLMLNAGMGESIFFESKRAVFDFEYHMGTDLDGVGQDRAISSIIDEVETDITTILSDETTEYRQKAREAVAEMWKDRIDSWVSIAKQSN